MSLFLFSMIFSNGPTTAVDTVRLSLEANSAFWFRLVKYSGYAVAFGCLLEAPETFVIIKRWWLIKFRDVEREEAKEDKKSWIIPLAAMGLIIIVVGIVAETYFEGKVSDADSEIREHESQVVSTAETNAATANGIAGDAEKKAAQLEKDAAQLQKDADAERLERVKLEAQVNPRRLTPKQEEEIGNSLKSYTGKNVMVATYSQDAEAMILAIQIGESLRKAKIKVFEMPGTYNAIGRPLYTGVVVDTNNAPDSKLVSSLAKALKTKGRLDALSAPVMFGAGSTMYTPSASDMGVVPGTVIKVDAFIFVGEKPVAEAPSQTKATTQTTKKSAKT